MIKTILFDLDGTLLPMDQDVFLKAYMGGLAKKMAPHGYEPDKLIKSIWVGTGAMVKNDGSVRNDEAFWNTFSAIYGRDTRVDEPIFEDFYRVEFQQAKDACGFNPMAAEAVKAIKAMGYHVALATNPLFPAIATHSRTKWAGLNPEDFDLITTYENSYHCKPNPDYYRDILATLNLKPEECVMVGNDASEDMVPAALGMKVFLLTDCIINKENKDISCYPHGSFPELLDFILAL
ncbi:MAG: HAD family hydrolase [Oscillospiraceae bacterium]|nr:HAD family hydrolase [Oscillospiraceae bacterium]